MTDFNDIQQLWDQQDLSARAPLHPQEIIRLAERNTRAVKAKHRWTIGILLMTVLFLIVYFVTYTDFTINRFFAGLSLMIIALVVRLAVEWVSYTNFQRIDIRSDLKTYSERVAKFYTGRKKIHFIVTPLMVLTYIIGFILLLPIFRQIFSYGFYLYIVISGTIFFIGFVAFVVKGIKKERALLMALRKVKIDDKG